MVSYKRKPVSYVPPPKQVANGSVASGTPIYTIEQTGEVFLSPQAHAERLAFYAQKAFTCESSGKSGMDFFTALHSEQSQSQAIQSTFPEALKLRVLRGVNFRVEARLDDLVSQVFDRFSHRFFAGEQCYVVVDSYRNPCQVLSIMPPAEMRALVSADAPAATNGSSERTPGQALSLADMTTSSTPDLSAQYAAIAHSIATDFSIEITEATEKDVVVDYEYTVQITPTEEDAAVPEPIKATPHQLSRDKAVWSKAIVKKFLRDSLERDSAVGSPWVLKERIASMYGIENTQTEEQKALVAEARKTRSSKRKRTRAEVDQQPQQPDAEDDGEPESYPDVPVSAPKRQARGPPDDLDIDPTTIFESLPEDADKSTLPLKGPFKRDLPVESSQFEALLAVWNFFNVFGGAINLSNFTLDAFVDALKYDKLEPRSSLLAEMHAALTIPVITEGLRISSTSTVASTGPMPETAADRANTDGMTVEERHQVIRRALVYVRKWDRSTRLKAFEGRKGWERHAIGAMVSKGGIHTMPDLARILKHLLAGLPEEKKEGYDDEEDELDEGATSMQVDQPAATAPASGTPGPSGTPVPGATPAEPEGPTPAELYLTLPISDKLIILEYLLDLCLHGKSVRQYIDETERFLTDVMQERQQIAKERKSALISKAAMERREAKAAAAGLPIEEIIPTPEPSPPPKEPTPPPIAEAEPVATNGNGFQRDDVPSDFDELDSNFDEIDELAGGDIDPPKPIITAPAAVVESTEPAEAEKPMTQREKLALKLEDIEYQEEFNDREARRWSQVGRITPLGQDRFYCRYYWLDGIGHMELVAADGWYLYGTGRLFVQGPKAEEQKLMEEKLGGADQVLERRRAEEGMDEPLGVDEWAYIDEEVEINRLIAHLNPKGRREGPLRTQLEKWKPYILGGADNRPMIAPPNLDPRRQGRPPKEPKEPAPSLNENYFLAYRNTMAIAAKEPRAPGTGSKSKKKKAAVDPPPAEVTPA